MRTTQDQHNPFFILLLIIISSIFLIICLNYFGLNSFTCYPNENRISIPQKKTDCAYLFMISSNAYFPCLTVAIHSLQNTGTELDIIVFLTPNIWDYLEEAVKELNVIVKRIEGVQNPNKSIKRNHLRDNFTKLRAWQLDEYSKIIYSDVDFIYTKNSDDLCSLDYSVNAGRNFISKLGEWPDETFFNAGFMVISPSTQTFCNMREASLDFKSNTGGDQPFQNLYWKDIWHELDYKYDGANANIFFTRNEEWYPEYIRSIHYTRATNPCNYRFEDDLKEKWNEFEIYGYPDKSVYNPLVIWLETKNSLLEQYPHFEDYFNECGFMLGWDDGGNAGEKYYHKLGFL